MSNKLFSIISKKEKIIFNDRLSKNKMHQHLGACNYLLVTTYVYLGLSKKYFVKHSNPRKSHF